MDGRLWELEHQRISIETEAACECVQAARLLNTPSAIYKPELFQDGNAWIAVFGRDMAVGVVGCGETPALAFKDFDRAWHAKAVVPVLKNVQTLGIDAARSPAADDHTVEIAKERI